MIAARPWTIGFRVRSAIGRCSSSSSRVRGRTEICCSRACTGSSCWPTRNEANTRKTPKATTPARTRISTLDLDVRDLLDREEADEHHDPADDEQDLANELREERLHELRVDQVERDHDGDRQERDEVTRVAALRGQGADLALDADTLADRERDRVQDLREVSTDLLLDADGGDHEVEVVAFDPADEVRERLLHAQAEVHLADDAPHLRAHRRGRFTRHELDRLEEARARAQGVRGQHDRVGELLVEGVEAASDASADPHPRNEIPEERSDQGRERIARQEQDRGETEREADADVVVLRDPQAKVGACEIALHARAEALVLDIAGEGRERIDLPAALLALLLGLWRRRLLAAGVALHARAERLGRGSAEHRRNAPEEQEHADEGGRRDDVFETDQRRPEDISPKTFCGSLMPAASNFSENFGRMPVGRRRPWTFPST